jgi:hypothetical protein
VLVTTNNGAARLLRNDGAENRAVRLTLKGVAANRDAIGTRVTAHFNNNTRRAQMVKTGSSYLSQSELPLTFGVGPAGPVAKFAIEWPSGRAEQIAGGQPGQTLFIEEGRGIVKTEPFVTRPISPTSGPRR